MADIRGALSTRVVPLALLCTGKASEECARHHAKEFSVIHHHKQLYRPGECCIPALTTKTELLETCRHACPVAAEGKSWWCSG